MKKANKKFLIIIAIIIIAVIAVVGTILLIGNGGHRVIKVDKVSGEASLVREETKQEIYEGSNLKSQDAVITGQDGQVELLVDSDKHIWAQENTKFKVVSSGNENKGKLKIELQYGTSLVEIEEKLPEGAFFEVETPNATVGVRGTIFETSYYEEENKTVVQVTSGVVEVISDTESVMVEAGQSAVVVDDDVELVDDTENTDASGESNSNVVETYVEDANLPIMYSTNSNAFELAYQMTTDGIGVFVKNLKDFTPEIKGDEYTKNFYLNNKDMSIEYVVYRKEGVNVVLNAIKDTTEAFEIQSLDTMVNQDGNTVLAFKYLVKYDNHVVYSYIKKISDDMYLWIALEDKTDGQIFGEDTFDTYLPLTMNCYYDYATDLTLNMEMDIETLAY